jgi:hypothetical protein
LKNKGKHTVTRPPKKPKSQKTKTMTTTNANTATAAATQAQAVAAWCKRSQPYAFFVKEVAKDENLARCVPACFKAQAQKGASCFSLSSEDITQRRFSIVINDPTLMQPEMGMLLDDETKASFSELPLSATAPGNRYAYLQAKVLEHYKQAFQAGNNPYTGVKLKLHLSAIMDSQGKMVIQVPGAKELPEGTGWLKGFKSATLLVGPEYVEQGLFSLEEYHGLHEYATLAGLITQLDGTRYSSVNAKQRQYLTPKPGVEATFQFQMVPRLNPTSNVYVPGLADIRWFGFMVVGLNSGGLAQETARPATTAPQETADLPPLPALPVPTTPVFTTEDEDVKF